MSQILLVETSPRKDKSASREVSAAVIRRLTTEHSKAAVIVRDLDIDPIPHLDQASVASFFEAPQSTSKDALSDKLIAELLESETIVISTPMYNFGIPSALKAWIDHVVRVGKTFNYAGADRVEGLATGKKAILVIASGGVFTEGPWKSWDFVEPYLRQILGFIGIDDVQAVRVEGLNVPAIAPQAVPSSLKAVDALVLGELVAT